MSDLFSLLDREPAGRRLGLLVLGPNASGKTTAVREALAPFQGDLRVVGVHADKSPYGQLSAEAGSALLGQIWGGRASAVVVEGTRCGTMLARLLEASPSAREAALILTAVTPETMRAHIEARCRRVGKRFRSDYWAGVKLVAHAGRHRREAERHFAGLPTEVFEIGPAYEGSEALVRAIRERVRVCLETS